MGNGNHSPWVAITLAVIAALSTLAAAVIANWDKLSDRVDRTNRQHEMGSSDNHSAPVTQGQSSPPEATSAPQAETPEPSTAVDVAAGVQGETQDGPPFEEGSYRLYSIGGVVESYATSLRVSRLTDDRYEAKARWTTRLLWSGEFVRTPQDDGKHLWTVKIMSSNAPEAIPSGTEVIYSEGVLTLAETEWHLRSY